MKIDETMEWRIIQLARLDYTKQTRQDSSVFPNPEYLKIYTKEYQRLVEYDLKLKVRKDERSAARNEKMKVKILRDDKLLRAIRRSVYKDSDNINLGETMHHGRTDFTMPYANESANDYAERMELRKEYTKAGFKNMNELVVYCLYNNCSKSEAITKGKIQKEIEDSLNQVSDGRNNT